MNRFQIRLSKNLYRNIRNDPFAIPVIDLEPEAAAAWMPTAPRYKRERAEPASNPTQVSGFIPHPSDDGLILEIEDPDPWAQDSEPIFWTD